MVGFPEREINDASQRLLDTHLRKFNGNELILMQVCHFFMSSPPACTADAYDVLSNTLFCFSASKGPHCSSV